MSDLVRARAAYGRSPDHAVAFAALLIERLAIPSTVDEIIERARAGWAAVGPTETNTSCSVLADRLALERVLTRVAGYDVARAMALYARDDAGGRLRVRQLAEIASRRRAELCPGDVESETYRRLFDRGCWPRWLTADQRPGFIRNVMRYVIGDLRRAAGPFTDGDPDAVPSPPQSEVDTEAEEAVVAALRMMDLEERALLHGRWFLELTEPELRWLVGDPKSQHYAIRRAQKRFGEYLAAVLGERRPVQGNASPDRDDGRTRAARTVRVRASRRPRPDPADIGWRLSSPRDWPRTVPARARLEGADCDDGRRAADVTGIHRRLTDDDIARIAAGWLLACGWGALDRSRAGLWTHLEWCAVDADELCRVFVPPVGRCPARVPENGRRCLSSWLVEHVGVSRRGASMVLGVAIEHERSRTIVDPETRTTGEAPDDAAREGNGETL